MWYLFLQIWLWLLLAFVLGWFCHYWWNKVQSGPRESDAAGFMGASAQTVAPEDDPDDLMRISGIGQVLSATLNKELGVYQFAQIAAWTDKDIEKIEQFLKFSGRVQREDWIAQAKVLVAEKEG